VGDSVIVAANEPLSLTAKWDPQYEVTRIRGTTHWLRHQPTGKEIRVHMDKLRLVDPNMGWDEVSPRPRRQTHIRRAPPVSPPLLALRHSLPVEPAGRANEPVRAPHGAARRQQTAPQPENTAGQNNKRRRVDSPPGEPTQPHLAENIIRPHPGAPPPPTATNNMGTRPTTRPEPPLNMATTPARRPAPPSAVTRPPGTWHHLELWILTLPPTSDHTTCACARGRSSRSTHLSLGNQTPSYISEHVLNASSSHTVS
jgi:hypothetical protein